jgi:hypothetical protein
MPELARPLTWGDVMEFVTMNGLHHEEYFSLCQGVKATDEVWKDARWVAVYWVEGGSEGYYLHIDRIVWNEERQVNETQTYALGKFWSKASAAVAVTWLTPFVYGLNPV